MEEKKKEKNYELYIAHINCYHFQIMQTHLN